MTSVPVRRRHLPMTAFRETAVTRTTVVKTTAVTMTIAKKTREDGHVGGVGVLPLRKRGAGPGRDAVLVSEGARCCAVSAEGGVRIDFLWVDMVGSGRWSKFGMCCRVRRNEDGTVVLSQGD